MAFEGVLVDGVRNNGLTSYAGRLRARGLGRDEILVSLREANQERCVPPLTDDRELRNIAKSAAKWAPHPTGDGHRHHLIVPRGCFNPRACGFDAAAVVDADTTLGLRRRHKAVYNFLAGVFGPYGCHPSQDTVAEALGIIRQQVTRDIKRLVDVGLIQVEPGAYRKAEGRHTANTYHFRKHHLFAADFALRTSRIVNEITDFSQHFDGAWDSLGFRYSNFGSENLATQRDSGFLATQNVALEPIRQAGTGLRKYIRPDQHITQFTECATGCGGCRIEYADGTVKRYECSCGS
jgi:hypothetical protein